VETHPHPYPCVVWPGMPLQRPLSLDRGGESPGRREKRDEERISLRVDLDSAVGPKGLAEQPLMGLEHFGVALPQALEQPGASLDVGEQKGNCPRRKVASVRPPRPHGPIMLPSGFGLDNRRDEP
jgi:hypothetical protein